MRKIRDEFERAGQVNSYIIVHIIYILILLCTMQIPLKLPLQLKWRRCPDMPFRRKYTHSVQVQGTLFIGGGTALRDNDYMVMAYDISAGKWATLPPYSTRSFGMTAVDNHLVIVGGEGCDGSLSKVLGVWSEKSKKWSHPYPDMNTPRFACSSFTYRQWLVVAGGGGAGVRKLSSVEVMNTDTKQWYAGPPTPIAWHSMKTAILDDTCYFMGGYIETLANTDKVYSVSLPALISQLRSAKDTQTWKELPQLPVTYASPLTIRGFLLAVGGMDKGRKVVSALHLYQPDAELWVKVADMPTPRHTHTCIMITKNELLVTGGYNAGLDIAQVL